MVYQVTRSYYSSLTRNGVRVYEWTPGFCHCKMCVTDDEAATCGTSNLDYRSLYHHFECATYLYRCKCISEIEADYQETLLKCREVTPETIRQEKLSYKVMGAVLKAIAPLM